jgi:small subunit ribosomal protein S16
LARTGAKKKSSFRVVVIERERARDGRFVEILGHYNPRRTPPEIVLNRERLDYWIGRGAQPSETVQSFLKKPPAAPA